MENKIVISKMICKRCGHIWTPRQQIIYVCPKCKSPKWNVEKEFKA